jgi:hypothetical protein
MMNCRFSSALLLILGFCPIALVAQEQMSPAVLAQLAKLTGSDTTSADQFGASVAISGNTVVIGAPYAQIGSNQSEGAAYVFVKPSSGWSNMTQVAKLTASDGAANSHFGVSVAISGSTIVVGTGTSGTVWSVYVYAMPKGGWTDMSETAELSAGSAASNGWGSSVAISGNVIVAGAPGVQVKYFAQGAAFVFVKPKNGWVSTGKYSAELTASDASGGELLGSSVSISGNTIVTGAKEATVGSNGYQGAAYVFLKPASGWKTASSTAKLTASDGQYNDMFGSAVSINGNTVLIGAPYHSSIPYLGAAYIFVKPSNGWKNATQSAELTASSCGLGYSVAVTSTEAVAGDTTGNCGGQAGAAYEFNKPASGWISTSQYANELTALDGFQDDEFGNSVAIAGTTIIVGAPRFPASIGAAYVF